MLGAGFKPVVRYLVSQVGSTPTGFRHLNIIESTNFDEIVPWDKLDSAAILRLHRRRTEPWLELYHLSQQIGHEHSV